PNANYFGSDSFTYIVTDGSASSAATTVSLTVTAVNDAPVAVNDAYTLNEDAPLTIAAPGVLGNDTDVDTAAGSLTTVLQNGPATGTLTLAANGGFTYTTNANFKGSDSFTYFVNDGALNSTTPATVTLTVNAVNDPPTITGPANVTILEDQSTSALAVTVGDVETAAGSLVVTATSGNTSVIPNAGIVLGGSGASRTVTVTPAANANGGPVTITLTVTDAGSASTSASFDVTVTPVNDAPGFVVGPNRNEAPGTGLRTVPNWATAISAGPANEALQTVDFEESEASDPANVVTNVEVEANGTLRYVLTGASGMATINLQLRDNGGTANGGIDVSPVATFTIMVEAGADLSTAMVGSFNPIDGLVNYTITITNGGPSAVTGATVVNAIPAGLTGYSWTCTGVSGGACPTNAGSGSINFLVNLPASGSVIIQSQGTYSTTTPPVTIVNTASATSPMGIPDNVPGNNSATVSLTIPLFGNGFEPGSPVVALDKSMPGSWSAAAIDGGALAGAVRGVHPEEAVRFVRGGSTVVLFVRGIDGRTEARLAQRTGKSAAWAADEWQAADAVGLQLQWLSAANGDDVEAAELRKAAR
ncbi:MAG: tandem-95 repeat protein, partial [Pseudomonadota bacterium]